MILKTVPILKTSEHRSSEFPNLKVYVHAVLLFDMYIDGAWHGSRRTQLQCDGYFFHAIWVEEMIRTRGQHEYEKLLKAGVGSRSYRECEARGELHVINGLIA